MVTFVKSGSGGRGTHHTNNGTGWEGAAPSSSARALKALPSRHVSLFVRDVSSSVKRCLRVWHDFATMGKKFKSVRNPADSVDTWAVVPCMYLRLDVCPASHLFGSPTAEFLWVQGSEARKCKRAPNESRQ